MKLSSDLAVPAKLRMNRAISVAIGDAMREDPDVIFLGEDIAASGGVFATSEGLLEEFGRERVRNTPISEMGFLGAAVGAAMAGVPTVVEIMFMEFIGVALDQLATQAAKVSFLTRGEVSVPLVVRGSVGAGLGFGAQHSQTLEGWLCSTPGLKVVMPSDPQSAYGLTRAAIAEPGPVVVLEPRALYGRRGFVDRSPALIPHIGNAIVRRTGEAATVLATGQMVPVALEAAEALAARFSLEVIDAQTLVPWDVETIADSVRRTGKIAILEAAPLLGSWGNEVAAWCASWLIEDLAAPVLRVTAPNTPVPFATSLESAWVPGVGYVVEQVTAWLETGRVPRPWWTAIEEGYAE